MLIKKSPEGTYVDAKTGKDLTDLIAAYKLVEARSAAGHAGGSARSARKRRAARENGKLGGRPRKK